MDAKLWDKEKGLWASGCLRPQLLAIFSPSGSSARMLGYSVTSLSDCHGTLASKRLRTQGSHTHLWHLAAKPHPAHSPLALRPSVFLRENNSSPWVNYYGWRGKKWTTQSSGRGTR